MVPVQSTNSRGTGTLLLGAFGPSCDWIGRDFACPVGGDKQYAPR